MTNESGSRTALPAGWQRHVLKDLCSFQVGPAIKGEERTDVGQGVRLVLPRDVVHQRVTPSQDIKVTSAKARTLDKYRLAEGDVLVVRTGTVGRCALVAGEQDGWLYHANLIRLRLAESDQHLAAYLVGYLSAGVAQSWIHRRSSGAVIPSLSARELGDLPVLVPPADEQRAIGETLAALDEQVRVHTEIARAAGEYRGLLADLLMAGALPAGP
ncbi:restriction endonuclease subunit S [Streptomyces zaehneri]|uniref:restriction endonuclease subunit S n=1 Tax=Streptomyces zaehneri TaxID=3051180 RepID=UPI0028D1873F|nr:restriction endonuclease subunit S [Streptomyces sp. DSM 40713]